MTDSTEASAQTPGVPAEPRYRCTRCGRCCRWEGYVHVTREEIERIAEFLDVPVHEFTDCYIRLTDRRTGLALAERADEACVFLEGDNTCLINPVKPKQCRDFPNGWNFPGFDQDCQAVDTWGEDAPGDASVASGDDSCG